MSMMKAYPPARAIHHDGVLSLLEPLELPEGALMHLFVVPLAQVDQTLATGFVYPTRLVPAERLDTLTGVVAVGGDALADSEALYDPDWS